MVGIGRWYGREWAQRACVVCVVGVLVASCGDDGPAGLGGEMDGGEMDAALPPDDGGEGEPRDEAGLPMEAGLPSDAGVAEDAGAAMDAGVAMDAGADAAWMPPGDAGDAGDAAAEPAQAAATPSFDPPAGTYTGSQTVTLSTATAGATIHYTVDGSEPTPSSPAYMGPLQVSTDTTLRAVAVKEGLADSAVASAAYTIERSDQHVYLADGSGGLRIVSLADPENPTEVGSLSDFDAHGVDVAGDHAYVLDDAQEKLRVIDISDRSSPSEVGSVMLNAGGKAIRVDGDYAYVGEGSDIRVIDISSPTSPSAVHTVSTTGDRDASSIEVVADYAYVAAKQAGLQIIDISSPTSASEVSALAPHSNLDRGVAVQGDYAHVAAYADGYRVVDVSDPTSPMQVKVIASGPKESFYMDSDVADDHAYILGRSTCLHVFDISTPSSPSEVGSLDPTGASCDWLVFDDGIVYIGHSLGLHLVDVSDPSQPREIGSLTTPGSGVDDVVVAP